MNEVNIDSGLIEKIQKLLKNKGQELSSFFEFSDSDKNGLVNILDLKIGLEKILEPDQATFKLIISFIKDIKSVFKTSDFSKGRLLLLMSDPKACLIHRGIIDLSKNMM